LILVVTHKVHELHVPQDPLKKSCDGLLQMLLEGVLGGNGAVACAALVVLWPFCVPRKPLRKAAVAGLRRAQASQSIARRTSAAKGFLILIVHSLLESAEEVDMESDSVAFSQLAPTYEQCMSLKSCRRSAPVAIVLSLELPNADFTMKSC
jgi:hypothetical protein